MMASIGTKLQVIGLLAFSLVAGLAAEPAFAQRGGGFRDPSDPFRLLSEDEVEEELKITDSQKEQLEKLQEEAREAESQQPRPDFGNLQDEAQRQAAFAEMRKQREKRHDEAMTKIKGVLAENQYERLEQVRYQKMGPQAFQTELVSTELKLSDAQKQTIAATLQELQAVQFNFRAPREERDKATQEANAKILAALSADQKSAWEKKLGPPLESEDGSNSNSQAPAATASGTTNPAPNAPATYTPPEGEGPTVISFDGGKTVVAANEDGGKSPAPAVAATPKSTYAPPDKDRTIRFHLENAPWEMVLKEFARKANLTLQILDLPPGSVTYTNDENWYTPTEALDILHGYLLQQGYVMIQRDRFLVILTPDNRPIPPNLIPNVSVEDLIQPGKFGKHTLLSVVLPLEGAEANDAAREVEMLKGPQGSVVPLSVSNSLVVTDSATNLRRIHNLLKGVTTKASPDELTFKSFPLKHVAAAEAEIIVKDQLGVATTTSSSSDRSRGFSFGFGGSSNSSSRSSTPSTPSAKVTADPRTNSVLVTATKVQLAIAEQILMTVDISEDQLSNSGSWGKGIPYLRVYHLQNADADEVERTVNAIMPGLILNSDDRDEVLHVKATEKQHEEISALIAKLDGTSAQSVAVIPLSKLDPVGVVGMLNGLFASDGDTAPMIQADTLYGRRLVIRGSADQVTQVKLLLAQMGEDGTGTADDSIAKGPFRTIPLGGRDAEEFARILEQVWGRTSDTPIRIVIPSASPIRGLSVPSARNEDEERFDFLRQYPASQNRPKPTGLEQNSTSLPKKPLYQVSTEAVDQNAAPAKAEEPSEDQSATPAETGTAVLRIGSTGEMSLDGEVFTSPARLSIRLGQWMETTPEADRKFTLRIHPETPALKLTPILAVLKTRGIQYSMEVAPDEEDAPAEPEPKNDENLIPQGDAQSKTAPEKNQPSVAAGSKQLPITLTVRGGELMLYDPNGESQSLDQMEAIIEQLALAIPPRTTWTVYYLRSAEVTETAAMLEQLFPSSSVSTSLADDGSFFGGLTSSISSLSGSLVDAAGLNSLTSSPAALRIIPELRSNSLFVSGPVDQVRQVEEMLRVLDADELPQTLRERVPRMIPVEHANVNEVATIVKDVYRDYLEDANDRRNQQNPLAMMMGGGRSNGNNNNRGNAPSSVKMTIGVDAQTSNLVVSASDGLFRQVEEMVAELDKAAYDARRTVQVVPVNESNAVVVQQALTALLPNVSISTTSSNDRGSNNNNNNNQPSWGGGNSSEDAERRARWEAYARSRSEGGDSNRGSSGFSGSSRGGDSGRGSSGFSGFNRGGDSGRGSSGFSGFSRGGDSGRSFNFGGRGGDSGRGR